MNIFSASKNDYIHIQNFLIPYEHTCVLLASYVRRGSEHIFIISQETSITNHTDIFGILYLDKTLLHCIPLTQSDEIKNELKESLYLFLKNPYCKIKCINGEQNVSAFIVEILADLGHTPSQTNSYQLMTLETKTNVCTPPEPLSNGDEIIRCTEHDIDLLMDLQKKYLIKEVAPVGKEVTDLECRLSLKQILKNQLCFALYSDGEIVAKANTNAIGLHWIQIGGVFTHPLYRRNHYAWHLVYTICNRIQKTNRNICLFVKDRNNPARELYKHLGFKESCSFKIIYFQ